ncbi:MAG TPA: hypothetical protein VF611_11115 [Pyrinomonadaceae bacterium]|jgi:hypothetical protein
MRPKLLDNFGRALIVCLFSSLAAAAQESPAPSAAQATPASAPPAKLVVQVEYLKGARPAYQSVPEGSWYGAFATVATPQPRAAADRVQAVNVKTRMAEGGRVVEIRVGVHVGERHFDRLEVVGTYHAAAGETVTARDLERVGVAPFVFSVLPVRDADAAPPSVVNLTQSVEAVVTDFSPTPLPRGRLTLRNLSTKGVRAVYIRQVVAGRNRGVGFLKGSEGKTLIEPGGSAEKPFGLTTGESSGAGFMPAAVESLVVAAVVFDDYTHEGEAQHAAMYRAFAEGERAQLPRLMALVREAHASRDVASAEAARRFGEKVAALADEAPPWAAEAVLKGYTGLVSPGPGGWKSAAEVSMHAARRDLLEDLGRFEQKLRESPSEDGFKRWLKQKQAFFEGWLARL